MTQHTPGPWEFVSKLTASENHKGFFIRAEKATRNGKWALADVQPGDEDGMLGTANARLIAAAPELLRACVLVSEVAPLVAAWLAANDHCAYAQVCAAVAKATGADK